MYTLQYLKPAERYFRKIKDNGLKTAFRKALEAIAQNPRSGQMKSGDLAGVYCKDVYYNRTNYEIAYRIYEREEKLVVVIMAGTRENFYKTLKEYFN